MYYEFVLSAFYRGVVLAQFLKDQHRHHLCVEVVCVEVESNDRFYFGLFRMVCANKNKHKQTKNTFPPPNPPSFLPLSHLDLYVVIEALLYFTNELLHIQTRLFSQWCGGCE